MMDARLLSDLLALSAQAACLVVLGGALPWLLRVHAPGVRYTWFRLLLVVCVLLPGMQGRHAATDATVTTSFVPIGVAAPVEPTGAATAMTFPWAAAFGLVIAAGIVVRALWIAAGLVRLARLRHAGVAAHSSAGCEELQQMLGTRAEIRYLPDLAHPVTFGLRRPVVLLPESLRDHPAHIQRAVISHELIHVQRRDWGWLLAEEAVRAALWFHPGIWWLISRVQLTREEVVDELAVLATGTRRAYMEALAAFADETPLVPAAAFSRRRHLFRRMRLLSREVGMSSRRIALSCAAMAMVASAGSWYAVSAFPLREAAAQDVRGDVGPLERQAKEITPENPVPRRTYSVEPQYTPEAATVQANAVITLMITLDQTGHVAEVRRVGVSPVLPRTPTTDDTAMRAALESLVLSAADAVRQWQYDAPANAPLSIRVIFGFSPTGAPRLVAHDGWSSSVPSGFISGARGNAGLAAAPPPPPPPPARTDSTDRPVWANDALRIGGAILPPTKTKHVNPIYPDIAQSAKVQGVVILEARIGPDGKVSHARVLRSVPLLDQAALDAVMQWEFTPTRLNGQPVPVFMTMTVQFTLS